MDSVAVYSEPHFLGCQALLGVGTLSDSLVRAWTEISFFASIQSAKSVCIGG